MKLKQMSLGIGLSFALASGLAGGQGCGGTGTGNPGYASGTNNPVVNSLLQAICNVLVSCSSGSLSALACDAGISATSGFDVTLGLPSGSYTDFAAILNAEGAGTLMPNASALSTCISDIGALSCGDPAVEAAYQPGASNPFADAPAMMPTAPGSCGSVY